MVPGRFRAHTPSDGADGAGNGVGRFTLPLSGVPEAFHGLTIYLVWELATGGSVAYVTPVSEVVLD